MENNNLNWEMVPEGWALCFNQNFPLHEACLRYQAGLLAPQSLTIARRTAQNIGFVPSNLSYCHTIYHGATSSFKARCAIL